IVGGAVMRKLPVSKRSPSAGSGEGVYVFPMFLTVLLLCPCLSAFAQTNYDTSPKAQTGEQVYGSYFGTDVDTVGLYNGNLSLHIGLIQLPGRELPMGVSFSFNNEKWELQSCPDAEGGSYNCGLYTGGWRLQTPF